MRLLLDEHISPEVARQLRGLGYDVVAVGEARRLRSRADRVHFATAPEERRAIATQDIGDYRPLLRVAVDSGVKTYGLICIPADFPLNRRSIGILISALQDKLDAYPGDEDLVRKMGGEDWLKSPGRFS